MDKPCKHGHTSGRDKRGDCIDCVVGYRRKWYSANKETDHAASKRWRLANSDRVRKRNTNWWRERKHELVVYKGGRCVDCDGIFPDCCYDFDHRDPNEKSFTISETNRPMEELKAEADKCDLVCANCHRIRTTGNQALSEKIRAGIRNRKISSP